MRIAIVGGTGKEGRGLAVRWSRAGHTVVLGSRDAARAEAGAAELTQAGLAAGGSAAPVLGMGNAACIVGADVVVLSVPYGAHHETLEALKDVLQGKILLDITVPLKPPKVSVVQLPAGQSAALEAQAIVGPGCQVVAGLHHVSSVQLSDPSHPIDCDVLVVSDHEEAKTKVIALIEELAVKAYDAGPLRNAVALESLTPVLIHLNKRYKGHGAGVRFSHVGGG